MDPLTAGGGPAELRALLVLDALPGVGPARLRLLVETFGSAVSALAARRGAFSAIGGADAAERRRDPDVRRSVDDALDTAAARGITVVSWCDSDYPRRLRHLADPPPVLFVRGRLPLLSAGGVTIVGARRATARARDLATRLGTALARAGVPVVSGLALGVDGAAHRGAVAGGGPTVAVLGTGPDVPYPRSNVPLYREVVRVGAIVSEFLPGTPALPHHFPRRNRILAALGDATVVVEAGARSGSLITVDHALDLGREVWVVPGPVERAMCAGSNALLLEGARPLLSVAQLVNELAPNVAGDAGPRSPSGGVGPEAGRRRGRGVPGSDGPPDAVGDEDGGGVAATLDEVDRAVLRALEGGTASGDEVASRAGLAVGDALARLTRLELHGLIRRAPGMRFTTAA